MIFIFIYIRYIIFFSNFSDLITIEETALNSDESDTQSAPETPSEAATVPAPQVATPSTTTAATQVCTTYGIDGVSQTSSSTVPNTTISNTNTSANNPPSEPSEEKVTPYYHSILQQVAEGNTSGETASSNAQRVTINMRTFKVCIC